MVSAEGKRHVLGADIDKCGPSDDTLPPSSGQEVLLPIDGRKCTLVDCREEAQQAKPAQDCQDRLLDWSGRTAGGKGGDWNLDQGLLHDKVSAGDVPRSGQMEATAEE